MAARYERLERRDADLDSHFVEQSARWSAPCRSEREKRRRILSGRPGPRLGCACHIFAHLDRSNSSGSSDPVGFTYWKFRERYVRGNRGEDLFIALPRRPRRRSSLDQGSWRRCARPGEHRTGDGERQQRHTCLALLPNCDTGTTLIEGRLIPKQNSLLSLALSSRGGEGNARSSRLAAASFRTGTNTPALRRGQRLSLRSRISPTRAGLALPLLTFMTWPLRKFSAATLPARKSSALLGLAAITSSQNFSIALLSLT